MSRDGGRYCPASGNEPRLTDATGCGRCDGCGRWVKLTRKGRLRWHQRETSRKAA